mgnify:CR=1 FL=1
MDGPLLEGRVIYSIGEMFGFVSKLGKILESSKVPYLRSKKVAKLLKDLTVSEFTEVVRAMPLMKGATQTVKRLKEKNYKIGIISDSYTQATEIVARRLGMDFNVANTLEVKNGIFTGLLKMPMGWQKIGCSCRQSVCKRYHLIHMAKRYEVYPSNTVAVGDSMADFCMIERAGIGIWFNPVDRNILRNANYKVHGKDLRLILDYLKEPLFIPQ